MFLISKIKRYEIKPIKDCNPHYLIVLVPFIIEGWKQN